VPLLAQTKIAAGSDISQPLYRINIFAQTARSLAHRCYTSAATAAAAALALWGNYTVPCLPHCGRFHSQLHPAMHSLLAWPLPCYWVGWPMEWHPSCGSCSPTTRCCGSTRSATHGEEGFTARFDARLTSRHPANWVDHVQGAPTVTERAY
jgi:hypothetical protein